MPQIYDMGPTALLPLRRKAYLNLGIFYMPQIYNMGPTALLPLRRKAYCGFFRPKNPTAGFEPANLGTKGQHATTRPPKPFNHHTAYNLKPADSILRTFPLVSRDIRTTYTS